MIKLVESVGVSLAEIKYKRMSREMSETSEEEEDKREREKKKFLDEISDLWERETDHQSEGTIPKTSEFIDRTTINADRTCTKIEANW